MDLTISVSGFDTVQEDIDHAAKDILKRIPSALQTVGNELEEKLKLYAHDIWYSGYAPEKYDRRTDDPSLGTPLAASSNIEKTVNGASLLFSYEPVSDHVKPYWQGRADGDFLINILQTAKGGHWAYHTPPIPKRPYWNAFLDDLESGGAINAFIHGMSPDYVVIPEGGKKDVDFQAGESRLDE